MIEMKCKNIQLNERLFDKYIMKYQIKHKYTNIDKVYGNSSPRYTNPRGSFNSQSKAKTKTSVFLTSFEKPYSQNSFRKEQPKVSKSPKLIKQKETYSLKDLERLKKQYRLELLKSKSKDQLLEENLQLIEKVQNVTPRIDSWNKNLVQNILKLQNSEENTEGESFCMKLFEQNMKLIDKIENTRPKVQTWNKLKEKKEGKRNFIHPLSREKSFENLIQENTQMVERIENAPPKVQSWNYLHSKKVNLHIQRRTKEKQRKESEIFLKNVQLVQKIEDTPPKIESWANLKSMKHQLNKKKHELLNQFSLERKLYKLRKKIEEGEKRLRQQKLKYSKPYYLQQKQLSARKIQTKEEIMVKKHKDIIEKLRRTGTTGVTLKTGVKSANKPKDYSHLLVREIKRRRDHEKAVQINARLQKLRNSHRTAN